MLRDSGYDEVVLQPLRYGEPWAKLELDDDEVSSKMNLIIEDDEPAAKHESFLLIIEGQEPIILQQKSHMPMIKGHPYNSNLENKSTQVESKGVKQRVLKRKKVKFPKIQGYTLDIFLRRCKEAHDDDFDYSEVTEAHMLNIHIEFMITCRRCNYRGIVTISKHLISQNGCLDCMGKCPWDLPRFLLRAEEVHPGKYDYSMVRPDHFKGSASYLPVRCRRCHYEWNVCLRNHIHNSSGCPRCGGKLKWSLKDFLDLAFEVYGNTRYDHSLVTADDVRNTASCIPVRCLHCGHIWRPSIFHHLFTKSNCQGCAGFVPWSYDRLMGKLASMDDGSFDYSGIVKADIQGIKSKLNILCKVCGVRWHPTLGNFIGLKSHCPTCNRSNYYSKAQIKYLEELMKTENIDIQYALSPGGEYYIEGVGYVDGYCHAKKLAIEFHGNFWHGNLSIYHPDRPHPKKLTVTFGDLYRETMKRDQKIRDLGHNLITKWETDWDMKYPST